MVDEEIVRFLAEKAMGWVRTEWPDNGQGNPPWYWRLPNGLLKGMGWNPLRNIADAFELQTAIRALGPQVRRKYTRALNFEWSPDNPGEGRDWHMAAATARERSIAAVKALGGEL
jgi:hypothetical protein